tara:strand:- start:3436 stop:4464 length:1029 start_codon:yes stop_codon:yes gene_type:complete
MNNEKYQKYGKTKNVTDQKSLKQWMERFPELQGETFLVTEKIDGANFQLIFTKGEDLRFGSRNNELCLGSDFFDFQNAVLVQYAHYIECLQDYVDSNHDVDQIQLYGEIFGGGIQRRINYGPEKQYRVFHMKVDGRSLDPAEAFHIFATAGVPTHWWVPCFEIFTGFDHAAAFPIEDVITKCSIGEDLTGNRFIEGIVIEPLYTSYNIHHESEDVDSRFMAKKKSSRFCDAMGVKRKKTPQYEVSDNGKRLMGVWAGMFNDNRMQDLCSKLGRPTMMSQMGYYIKSLVKDVREDFINLHKSEFIGLTQGDRGVIMGSGGKLAAKIVRAEIDRQINELELNID